MAEDNLMPDLDPAAVVRHLLKMKGLDGNDYDPVPMPEGFRDDTSQLPRDAESAANNRQVMIDTLMGAGKGAVQGLLPAFAGALDLPPALGWTFPAAVTAAAATGGADAYKNSPGIQPTNIDPRRLPSDL